MHSTEDNIIGQGVYTKLYYGDLRIAYILNRKTNLRIETGAVYRNERNRINEYHDTYFYVGVRFTFRKLIYDF
jgi:hypothetical protein